MIALRVKKIMNDRSWLYEGHCHLPQPPMDTHAQSNNIIHSTLSQSNQNPISKTPQPGERFFRASVTVEAALTLPLLILLCSLFFTFFSSQIMEIRLQNALDEISEDIAVWSYAVEFAEEYTGSGLIKLAEGGLLNGALGGNTEDLVTLLSGHANIEEEIKFFLLQKGAALIWQPLLKGWLIEKLGAERLNNSCLEGGASGLSLTGSTLQEREIDLVLSYRISSVVSFPFRISVPVVQRSCRRLWIGTARAQDDPEDPETEEEGTVYVTVSGTVYHLSKECRVLNIRPQEVSYQTVGFLRNEAGGKYYPCEHCCRGKQGQLSNVYITSDGIRYHSTKSCSALKRTLIEIAVSEAKEKYRACYYCGNGT